MKTKFLIISLILTSTITLAQRKIADKFFDNYSYIKAIEFYKEVIKKGDSSQHVLTKLGDCYYNNSNSKEAAIWYKKALEKYPKTDPVYISKYIQTQRSLGNYEEALIWSEKVPEIYTPGQDYIQDLLLKDSLVLNIKNLDINTEYSDFGGFEYGNTFIFTSAAKTSDETGKKIYNWNGQPYLDLYQASISKKDTVIEFKDIDVINSKNINTPFHEASAVVTKDGKTIYFTRDNVTKRNKIDYDKKGTTHLKIYKATLESGVWHNIQELPFNDVVFSTGHPALSADEKKLYFTSDRDGGFGQTDIYEVDIIDNGNNYSTPRNLGENVNTSNREMFPFVAKDSVLYFSSDRHKGIGLLDIYSSNYIKDETSTPINLGVPYNSGNDDFAFFINSDDDSGYFSSNRPNGKGDDDIYSFNKYICIQTLEGVARDKRTEELLANATIKLIDEDGKILEETITSNDGAYAFKIDCDKTYSLLGTKQDYKDDLKEIFTTKENNFKNKVDLFLTPLIYNNQIVISPIFFDFDKWNIRTDAQSELEHIVNVMRVHPTMVIKIEAHTDSRGNDKYNLKLSDRRAKSTRDYLISRGIASNRIESAIGYGETQLLNKCSNKVRCSEEEHQVNRRSYFYIVKE